MVHQMVATVFLPEYFYLYLNTKTTALQVIGKNISNPRISMEDDEQHHTNRQEEY